MQLLDRLARRLLRTLNTNVLGGRVERSSTRAIRVSLSQNAGHPGVILGVLLILISSAAACAEENLGIRAPEGFSVSLFAGDDLAHDIYSLTFDSRGRVVVAGAGYIKTLHDDDGDGRADRATLYSSLPKSGAHGLLADGDALYASGDNGIWKFEDRDGDGLADGKPEQVVAGLGHQEHGCNGIERGPDGWLYVICGNDAGVNERFAGPGSPVTKPNCGAIVRFSPDGKQTQILAHGFRNPYDLCFGPHGQIFTVDADGERDHRLPWYAPNRLFDIATGMHHGWVLRGWQWSWNRPASYFDAVERSVEIGRGSPTGMLGYAHDRFPAKYRGGIFSACWTLGRIYHLPLKARGSTYDGEAEVFLETTGSVGFAPVDMAVGPDGAMYVAIGGRRTRGSVFRVAYTGELGAPSRLPKNDLERVLAAPQPLAAWSRAKWLPLARQMPQRAFEQAALDASLPQSWRQRAIEIVTEVPGRISLATARELLGTPLAERAVWSVGRSIDSTAAIQFLAEATQSNSPAVERAAWEALVCTEPTGEAVSANWRPLTDRRARAARILAVAKGWRGDNEAYREHFENDRSLDALWKRVAEGRADVKLAATAAKLLAETDRMRQDQAELLRLMVLGLGDISTDPSKPDRLAGYALADPPKDAPLEQLADAVKPLVVHGEGELLSEAARTLALLESGDEETIERIATQCAGDDPPDSDIHYLMCLSRMPGKRTSSATKDIAAAIARLDGKMRSRSWYPSRNWPDRVADTFSQLAKRDEALPAAVVAHAGFASPSQAFLFRKFPLAQQQAAARKLLVSAAQNDDDRWTSELVSLVATLPRDEALPALRGAWDDYGLRDAIALELVKQPQADDADRFADALTSIDPAVVERSAAALATLKLKPSDDQWLALLQGLRQACSAPPAKSARQALLNLFETWSGEKFSIKEKNDDLLGSYQACFTWFAKAHPTLAARLQSSAGDWASLSPRLSTIDWSAGDTSRGKLAFEKRSCVKCHAGTSPLGPDLAGAAGRFSRDDLFAAIVDPSRDVAPLYQATQIVTGSGRVYHGLVVYESPDGTLLTTGPDTTIRIAGDEIVSMGKSRTSLMPSGLLANASDQELVDLYAYLQSLNPARRASEQPPARRASEGSGSK
jgi:putative membrane-bound dehydrogenase-like protein